MKFWQFLRVRKRLWLPPVLVMLFIVIGLMVAARAARVVPFIHAFFQ